MRVSQGVPCGQNVLLFNPELFHEHEEVIIYTMEEFQRTYNSIREHINHISKLYMEIEREEEWKLLEYWPEIMESVHLIELNMNLIFEEKPLQAYLDAYLYQTFEALEMEIAESVSKVTGKLNLLLA